MQSMGQQAGVQSIPQPGRLKVWAEPEQPGLRYEFILNQPEHWLGRDVSCDLQVNAPLVSRRHARFERLPNGTYRITDNNSSNHIFFNAGGRYEQVQTRVLNDGERFEIGERRGEYVICLQYNQEVQALQPAPPVAIVPPQPAPPVAIVPPQPAPPVAIVPPQPAPPAAIVPQQSGPNALQSRHTRMYNPDEMRTILRAVDSSNQFSRVFELDKPQMTLGREIDRDICIPLNIISRHHATLVQVGQDSVGPVYKIVDNNSSNHLYVNGQQVSEHLLRDNDTVVIGRVEDRGYIVTLTFQRTSDVPTEVAFAPIDLRVVVPGHPLTLGRDASNAVTLDHPVISAQHLKIARVQSGDLTVEDTGSTNGTLLNGVTLKPHKPMPLREGMLIKLGPWRLEYRNGMLSAFNEQGVVKLDAVGLSVQVGGANERRLILNDVSLSIQPSEFVAVLGGSGAGKSTLMAALSGFKPADTPAKVLFNGQDYYAGFDNYRSLVGYVPQADIIHTDLTVKDALTYAAKLRLPAETTATEIEARVREVVQVLRLTGREDVEVGRLSGGQRKRVSIGVELLTKPSLFFLDEPTSGLDPGLEAEMMALMRELAERGHTIVLVTHALANIDKCHKVAIMADGGRLVFFGPAPDALAHFGVKEFHEIYNVTGVDVVVVKGQRINIHLPEDVAPWVAALRAQFESDPQMVSRSPKDISLLWVTALEQQFRGSPQYTKSITRHISMSNLPQPAPFNAPRPIGTSTQNPKSKSSTFDMRQFGLLSRRYLHIVSRDRRNLLFLLLQAPVIGLILGLVGHVTLQNGEQVGAFKSQEFDTNQLILLALMGCSVIWFGILNSAREIVRELPIYKRERMVNLSVGSYIGSKLSVLFLLCAVQVALMLVVMLPFTGIPYGVPISTPEFCGEAQSTTLALIELYFTLLLGAINGVAMGLALSAFMSSSERVASFMPLILLPQIILNPVMFSTIAAKFLTSGWTIFGLASIADVNGMAAHGYQAYLSGRPFSLEQCDQAVQQANAFNGDFGNYTRTFPHLLLCWAVLGVIAVGFTGLAYYLQLRKDKQAI